MEKKEKKEKREIPYLSNSEYKEQIKTNQAIEEQLSRDARIEEQTIRILLLGEKDSGKSTFFKQIQILHSGGYDEKDRLYYKKIVLRNIKVSILRLIAATVKLEIKCTFEDNELNFLSEIEKEKIRNAKEIEEISSVCKIIWNNKSIQQAYGQKNLYQLYEGTKYFLDKIDILGEKDYLPTDQDILHCTTKSLGVYETRFVSENMPFNLTDVGNQVGQRRKWINSFCDVSALIYWVDLCSYDLFCEDNPNEIKLVNSLNCFTEIVNDNKMKDVCMILFFTNLEEFKVKIKSKKIDCFGDFDSNECTMEASDLIVKKFTSACKEEKKRIFFHFVSVEDTENISIAFKDIKKNVLEIETKNVLDYY